MQLCCQFATKLSRNMRFPAMWYVRLAKAQISLHIRAVWSDSLLAAWIINECKATDRTSFGVSKLKKEAALAHLSLNLSKCHIVGNHMSRLKYCCWFETNTVLMTWFNSNLASSDFRHLLITFANSFDPDQNQQTVWHSDNLLFWKNFLKKLILKKKQQMTTKEWKITQHAKS